LVYTTVNAVKLVGKVATDIEDKGKQTISAAVGAVDSGIDGLHYLQDKGLLLPAAVAIAGLGAAFYAKSKISGLKSLIPSFGSSDKNMDKKKLKKLKLK